MSTERAAIFDVDGTLVATSHLHVVTWWEAFWQAGHQVPMREIHRVVGLSGGDLLDRTPATTTATPTRTRTRTSRSSRLITTSSSGRPARTT
jgi:beta-phosphoglucomutase-like phosphatase (HAD superfamily)